MMNKKEFYENINVVKISEDDMRRVRIMLNFLKGLEIKSFLEVGSVPEMTEMFANALGCSGTGINISEKVVNSYKGNSKNLKFVCGNIEEMELKEKFDLVIYGELIEHLDNVDEFVVKIKDSLNDNGYLLLTIPNLASLFNRISLLFGWQPRGINPSRKILLNPLTKYDYNWGHVSMFTYGSIRKFLEKSGFEILSTGCAYGGHDGESKLQSFIRKVMSIRPSFAECVIILARKI